MFIDLNNIEGKAESNFLMGVLRKKKIILGKSEMIELKKQSKSENKFKTVFDKIPSIQRSVSNLRTISDEEKNFLEVSRHQFIDLKHDYGIARVSLAIAINMLE